MAWGHCSLGASGCSSGSRLTPSPRSCSLASDDALSEAWLRAAALQRGVLCVVCLVVVMLLLRAV